MLQPMGCIKPRTKSVGIIGYEYPIYMRAKAPLHDTYGGQGTLVTSKLGILTIDYRPTTMWSEAEYHTAGFSKYVLATNHPIHGPADLRKYEVASVDCPIGQIQVELDKTAEFPTVNTPVPVYLKLAEALGIEPKWFNKVAEIYAATCLEGEDPYENDSFMDKADEILDLQDDEEYERLIAADHHGSEDSETIADVASNDGTEVTDTTVTKTGTTGLGDPNHILVGFAFPFEAGKAHLDERVPGLGELLKILHDPGIAKAITEHAEQLSSANSNGKIGVPDPGVGKVSSGADGPGDNPNLEGLGKQAHGPVPEVFKPGEDPQEHLWTMVRKGFLTVNPKRNELGKIELNQLNGNLLALLKRITDLNEQISEPELSPG